MNGGYSIVDCKGLNLLAQSKQTIPGLYKAVAAAYSTDKLMIAENCVYGEGVNLTDVPVFGIIEDGVYILTASILQVRVSSDDGVVITSLLT